MDGCAVCDVQVSVTCRGREEEEERRGEEERGKEERREVPW